VSEEFKAKIDQGKRGIAEGKIASSSTERGVSRAIEVYSREFDSVFLKLTPSIRALVKAKIHDLGSHLSDFSHHRLKGRSEYRLRAGDYRIIYEFEMNGNLVYDYRGIFCKDGIGKFWLGGKKYNLDTQVARIEWACACVQRKSRRGFLARRKPHVYTCETPVPCELN
jgi:mRNA-degrading endonuclease RelE of RelBE toxin-antitoxin system